MRGKWEKIPEQGFSSILMDFFSFAFEIRGQIEKNHSIFLARSHSTVGDSFVIETF